VPAAGRAAALLSSANRARMRRSGSTGHAALCEMPPDRRCPIRLSCAPCLGTLAGAGHLSRADEREPGVERDRSCYVRDVASRRVFRRLVADRALRFELMLSPIFAVLFVAAVVGGATSSAVIFGVGLLGSCLAVRRWLREQRIGVEARGLDELADQWLDKFRDYRDR
jgi:hypothetical protein